MKKDIEEAVSSAEGHSTSGMGHKQAMGADPMDQVRELLFGADRRAHDARLIELETKIDQMFASLRSDMAQKFQDLERQLKELSQSADHKRLASIHDIGAAIAELGSVVKSLGSDGKGK